jgi:hypothetical protein
MNNFLVIYHGGIMEQDRYGNAEFVDIQCLTVIFDDRPSFSEVVATAKEKIGWHDVDNIDVDGVLNVGPPPNVQRLIIPIKCQREWDNYVKSAMKTQKQVMEVVVHRLLVASRPRDENYYRGAEVMPTVPDAQSAPNMIPLSDPTNDCGTHDLYLDSTDDIPLAGTPYSLFAADHHFQECPLCSFHCRHFILSSVLVAGDNPDVLVDRTIRTHLHCGDGIIASNSHEFRNEEEPYAFAMAADSDDDHLVGELTESDIEMLKCIIPQHRDPSVHEFSDLSLSHDAFAEGRDDELLDAPEAGPTMMNEKGQIFKDLNALKRWLQHYTVLHKRPYRVLHSYKKHRYTVVCDKDQCPWRVCARVQKINRKWEITKVVGPHNCAEHELTTKHRQLTSTLIGKRLMGILQSEPNMKVRTIMRIVENVYDGCKITYGKAWRAKQCAWKMIYGDWKYGYE